MPMKPKASAASPPVPESYVVRIYRRSARAPARVAGTVEAIGRGGERSFKSLRELQRILAGTQRADN
jgi:hypothetical protein